MIYLQYSTKEAKKLRLNAPIQRWAIANQVDLNQVVTINLDYETWQDEKRWMTKPIQFKSSSEDGGFVTHYMYLRLFAPAKLDTPLKDYL